VKLIYENTGVPVEIGDVVMKDGDEYTVVGIDKQRWSRLFEQLNLIYKWISARSV
jgi:isopentenyl phosphate kinase